MWLPDLAASDGIAQARRVVEVRRIAKFRHFIERSKKRILALYGGARSGKSVSVAQHLAHRFTFDQDRIILVTRTTMPALKMTAYALIKSILAEYGTPYVPNRQDMTFTNESRNNVIYFKSLDDEEKIKSFEANIIWMEEPTENPYADFKQLSIRMNRPPAKHNRLYLTFNPVNADHWTVKEIVNGTRPDVDTMHSTYHDNPFLPQETIDILEGFRNLDDDYYRIYTLGQPGMLHNLIYQNWGTIDRVRIPGGANADPIAYGIDWGYNHPTAIMAGWDVDGVYYAHELMYRSRMVTPEIIDEMKRLGMSQSVPIYADPSRPDLIDELCKAGFNAKPASNDVKAGIWHLKAHRLVFTAESVNAIAEVRTYKWATSRDEVVAEHPVKVHDDAMDATRYLFYSVADEAGDTSTGAVGSAEMFSRVPDVWDGRGIPSM